MKYTKGRMGRVFVVRLEHGDIVHVCLEALAEHEGIRAAAVIGVGGADMNSLLVVGPEDGRKVPVHPMTHLIHEAHEIVATGTIFPDGEGRPTLHMHMACGRRDQTITGCVRAGVKAWRIMEFIVMEIEEAEARRLLDPETGFALLEPGAVGA